MNPRLWQLLLMAVKSIKTPSTPMSPARAAARPIPPPPPTPMRLLQTEYLLKGIFVGLVLYSGLLLAALPEDASTDGLTRFQLATLAGFGLALIVAACLRFRDALRARGRFLAFLLFLLLESPTLVYVGILGGAVVGLMLLRGELPRLDDEPRAALEQLFLPVIGGAALAGLVFGWLRQVRNGLTRLLLVLALAGSLVAGAFWGLDLPGLDLFGQTAGYQLANPSAFALQLLFSLPFFYLLTFSGQEEESEIEIAVMMGMLALGLTILFAVNHPPMAKVALLIPILLYFLYTIRILPGLRVMKHAFRGLSYARVGRHRRALLAFRRALHLQPQHRLARDGFWEVHRALDFEQLSRDPDMLALVDLDLCLDRAGSLLLSKPSSEQLIEAQRLLELVEQLDPRRKPVIAYWRAVLWTHQKQLDEAARELEQLLDPGTFGRDNPHRRSILLAGWQLALQLHEGLRQRVGLPQLTRPGRRVEAIQAVERHLAANSDDPAAIDLKKFLYDELTEEEYNHGAGGEDLAAPAVDHAYLQFLGMRLIQDEARWRRGGEYLRLAARGLPELGPSLFVQIAQAQQRAGLFEESRHNYELAKRAGLSAGWRSLDDEQRQAYFTAVKVLAEEALGRDDLDAAIENFRLYSESERSGIETLRVLASLYERRGDALAAARATDQALQYNSSDPDLLERKDRYYFSIQPEDLRRRLEQYGPGLDVAYCLQKSRWILDKFHDAEWLEVAHHLTSLVLVLKPESLVAKLLHARCLLRLGHREQAISLLEDVRGTEKPERFASSEDEEAWYTTAQLLADLYLEHNRADLAIPCLLDFRKSSKSGAKTLFKLGQAYEQLGDIARAKKCYEQVTAYEGNPLTYDAREALTRLG